MTDGKRVENRRVGSRRATAPTWWLVFSREVVDLWVGGKGLTLILFYSLLLGVWSYVLASNTELRLIAPKEMVWEMLEATIAVGCFITLIAGVDSIAGDRERATLEGLLLTPTSRRQIVVGKYLAVVSLWPGVLAITVPYLYVLAQGDEIFGQAVLLGALMGSILAPAMAALGTLVSVWSNTIKISMIVSLGIYLLILMPTSLPGHVQSGPIGLLFQEMSPMMATFHFMAKILVNHRHVAEVWTALLSPILCAVVFLGLLFVIAAPRLRLDPGEAFRWRPSWARIFGSLAIIWLMAAPAGSPARAQQAALADSPAPSAKIRSAALQVSIDMQHGVVDAGDSILYRTVVTNNDPAPSRPLTVAMNIINLDSKGEIVDPEDWSPQRTQYIERLAPGASTELSWRVNAILGGDYMVYMVAIPKPDGPEATSVPAASSGIHLTIRPFAKINPRGVLLYVIGTPVLLILGMWLLYRYRRRSIDHGGESGGATVASALVVVGLAAPLLSAWTGGTRAGPVSRGAVSETGVQRAQNPAPEIVVYASELPKHALSEFDFWNDPGSPGGKMVGTPNTGDELDPPPENDPHVAFPVQVKRGVPYRCWIHMKVGAPKGESQANMFWVQFSDAVDRSGREVFRPGTGSYLTARGPTQQGWAWVGCESPEPLIQFRTDGEVTVRLQAGMEGVGFDQFVLSPARFLKEPPSEAVIGKP